MTKPQPITIEQDELTSAILALLQSEFDYAPETSMEYRDMESTILHYLYTRESHYEPDQTIHVCDKDDCTNEGTFDDMHSTEDDGILCMDCLDKKTKAQERLNLIKDLTLVVRRNSDGSELTIRLYPLVSLIPGIDLTQKGDIITGTPWSCHTCGHSAYYEDDDRSICLICRSTKFYIAESVPRLICNGCGKDLEGRNRYRQIGGGMLCQVCRDINKDDVTKSVEDENGNTCEYCSQRPPIQFETEIGYACKMCFDKILEGQIKPLYSDES